MAFVFLVLAAASALLMVLVGAVTGAGKQYSEDQVARSGTAVPKNCWADGPFFLNFWEACRLDVTWNDGSTSSETSSYGEFSEDDIEQRHRIHDVEKDVSQGSGTYDLVVKDVSRPWAWLGYVLPLPFAAFGVLCLIIMAVLLKPSKPDEKKRKGKAGKTQAKQQQHRE